MATVDECHDALHRLADRLGDFRDSEGDDPSTPDRSISCRVRDLDVVFTGRLERGRLVDVRRQAGPKSGPKAQIRFDLTGDDLLALVDGTLDVAAAWVSGRLKVGAGFRDLLRLRSLI